LRGAPLSGLIGAKQGAGMAVDRRRVWGWYFFDWASQPYNTLLLTFIFGPYFAEVARAHFTAAGMAEEAAKAAAQAYWGYGLTAASVVIAVLAPVLGAIADSSGRRLVWVWLFSLFYVVGALGLWTLVPGAGEDALLLAVALFGIGFVGMEFATIFTNSLMPTLTEGDELGAISGTGFAFGYLGGLVALLAMLLLFAESGATGKTLLGNAPLLGLDPAQREGTRFVGPFSALWYVLFMIPFFLWVREPAGDRRPIDIGAAFRSLGGLLRSLPGRPSFLTFLLSSLAYRDALNGLYAFGGIYAGNVLGWSITQIGVFGILGGITAMLASWAGGRLDARLGPKPVIAGAIIVLIVVCLIVIGLGRDHLWLIPLSPDSGTADVIFYICGGLIGAAGGPLQAASRTMLLRHTPAHQAAEAFGIFALSGKVASVLTPLLIAVASTVSQDARVGISPVVVLFVIGLGLLVWVRPQGERAA
jgi:UMF1 family MFS transporter